MFKICQQVPHLYGVGQGALQIGNDALSLGNVRGTFSDMSFRLLKVLKERGAVHLNSPDSAPAPSSTRKVEHALPRSRRQSDEWSLPQFALRALHGPSDRSEEHTSELQSRRDLVCRLLLEK